MHFILHYMGKTHFTLRQKIAQVLDILFEKDLFPLENVF
jgi:hypothetical protein